MKLRKCIVDKKSLKKFYMHLLFSNVLIIKIKLYIFNNELEKILG